MAEMTNAHGKTNRVPAPAVGRAFSLLRLLAEEQIPMGVTQIAEALHLGKATVHALVHALAAEGALEEVEGKKYRVGPALEALAESRRERRSLEQVCRPLLEGLAGELDQTAILGVPEGDRLRIVAAVEGSINLRIGATPGTRIPLLAGAHGKILLAWGAVDPPEQIPSYTVRSITDPEALTQELETVRRSGVAYDRAEYLEGVVAAAAPVQDSSGDLRGVLYVVGLRDVIGEQGLSRVGHRVRQAAQVATRRLGGVP